MQLLMTDHDHTTGGQTDGISNIVFGFDPICFMDMTKDFTKNPDLIECI